MNEQLLKQIEELVAWIRETTDKAVCFSLDMWSYTSGNERKEYTIWVLNLFNQKFNDLDSLMCAIPHIKEQCLLKKEKAA